MIILQFQNVREKIVDELLHETNIPVDCALEKDRRLKLHDEEMFT